MDNILKNIPGLIRASLDGDKRSVELTAISLIRKIKKEHPKISQEIAEIITTYSAGASLTRSMGVTPPPADNDSFLSLVKVEEIKDLSDKLILEQETDEMIQRFVRERAVSQKLLSMGIKPPNSIILYGQPGVGKTLISKYLAKELMLPLITLDLSATISSYLGKTGQNLKKVLEYAKMSPCILLLDEFDAVAKRRDDPSDLGELKRIVNVLLKELEEWPSNSVLVAATNFPDYLDKAIWRRFDLKIEVPLPGSESRKRLWKEFLNESNTPSLTPDLLDLISTTVNQISPSDIKQICEKVVRRTVVDNGDPNLCLIQELRRRFDGNAGEFNKVMSQKLKEIYGRKISQAKIAELLGISTSTVNHHLKK
ncbi:AAA family ATPase [Bacillus safensis]|uniref:AAA family ATPase n=1 Tax=Bacillus safensis TaxID=561879 RepID=UPI0039786F6A